MQRWNSPDEVPADLGPAVVTIGNFDGVHRGHRAVLGETVRRARAIGGRSVAVTFDPHPVAVLRPEDAPTELTGLPTRLDLMAATGLDAVLVLHFTPDLAAQSPERFARATFAETLGATAVVVGRDMRFGHRNSGDVRTLRELGGQLGFEVVVVPDTGLGDLPGGAGEGGRSRWSSTWVRELLAVGDVSTAADMLGRPHRMTGAVVHGDHRGRQLGYPTANLADESEGMVPADGIYAGWLVRPELAPSDPDHRMPAAVSIGTNPTFAGTRRRVECHVLDRDDLDLYGERVTVEFVTRLRETVRFADVDALREQMARDVSRARAVLGVPQRV